MASRPQWGGSAPESVIEKEPIGSAPEHPRPYIEEPPPLPPAAIQINADFPEKLAFLLQPREKLPTGQYAMHGRYKVAWGGRGGVKSWSFAQALLIRGLKGGLRILCAREVQSSIKDSVHKLLKDQIVRLGLQAYYRVLDDQIRGPRGTEFSFKGLKDPEALKSAESVDIIWIEEARNVSKGSWERIIPTIRKPGSEIWISFNPELEIDETYQRFVIDPPPGAIVVKTGWQDNPWLSDELRMEKDHLKLKDPDAYLTVWEGHCRVALEGAVFANELRQVASEGRILAVPVERSKTVQTFWDLGRSDLTAIWFAQIVGFERRIVGYYANNGEELAHFLGVLQEKALERGYLYGTHWLPHDADHKLLGQKRTIKQQMQDAGHHVRIVPKLPVFERINAARTLFPSCYFDQKHTSEGLNALRHWHYEVDEAGNRGKNPVHDWSSNGSDAFTYMGVALREEVVKTKPKPPTAAKVRPGPTAWLGR